MTSTIATVLDFSDFAIIAWLFILFAGTRVFTTRKSAELRRLERKLDALLKHQGISMDQVGLSEEVKQLARDPAKKIAAIKLYREETGAGLADAKADIENFIKSSQ